MGKFFLMFIFLLVNNFLISQQIGSAIPDEEKSLYIEAAYSRVKRMGGTLARIARDKDNHETIEWGLNILDTLFHTSTSPIFHQFPGNTTTQQYSYRKFIEEFSKYNKVVINWEIFKDSIKWGPVFTEDAQSLSRVKSYKDLVFSVREYCLVQDKSNTIFEDRFQKSIIFRFKTIDGKPWEMFVERVTSLVREPITIRSGQKSEKGEIDAPPPGTNPPLPPDLIKPGLKPFIPAYGDYQLRPKNSGAHWLWAAGLGASIGASGYNFFKCNELFPGCRLPAAYYEVDFERYREAKLYRQNAIIFGVLAGAIYATDVIETYLAVGKMNRTARKSGNYQFGIKLEPVGFQSIGLNAGIRFNLSGNSTTTFYPH